MGFTKTERKKGSIESWSRDLMVIVVVENKILPNIIDIKFQTLNHILNFEIECRVQKSLLCPSNHYHFKSNFMAKTLKVLRRILKLSSKYVNIKLIIY